MSLLLCLELRKSWVPVAKNTIPRAFLCGLVETLIPANLTRKTTSGTHHKQPSVIGRLLQSIITEESPRFNEFMKWNIKSLEKGKVNIKYLFFSFWLPSLCIISSGSIYLIGIDSNVLFLQLSNIPLYICTTFLYPFICRWTSRLLPCPSYCK